MSDTIGDLVFCVNCNGDKFKLVTEHERVLIGECLQCHSRVIFVLADQGRYWRMKGE